MWSSYKFGGSSLAGAGRLPQVAALVEREDGAVVVVVSAIGKTTDILLQMGRLAEEGALAEAEQCLQRLIDEHRQAMGEGLDELPPAVSRCFDELKDLLKGIALLQERTDRTSATLVSFGERISAVVLAAVLQARGGSAEAVDARELLISDDGYAEARVDHEVSSKRAKERLTALTAKGTIPVVTGFIASTREGRTTTLGRGGSDYTATLLGNYIGAAAVVIWTDVSGILTADPRLVSEARTLPSVSYREAAEMSYFGAKVLHSRAIRPARQAGGRPGIQPPPAALVACRLQTAQGDVARRCMLCASLGDPRYHRQFWACCGGAAGAAV